MALGWDSIATQVEGAMTYPSVIPRGAKRSRRIHPRRSRRPDGVAQEDDQRYWRARRILSLARCSAELASAERSSPCATIRSSALRVKLRDAAPLPANSRK
jgi:hypothetical protein